MTTSDVERGPRILLVGVGALGGVIAHELILAGHDVTLLTHDPDLARTLRISGLREVRSGRVVLPKVIETAPAPGDQFDYVLLATQPTAVESVVPKLAGAIGDAGRFVCLQNGLCEDRVAEYVPRNRVIGAVVAFGASAHGPGLCERTSTGGVVVGNLDGALDETLERLTHLLSVLGPARSTTNLAGIRWSKLAVNCAISTLGTIGGERLGVVLRRKNVRRLALRIVAEAVKVATALGVTLERLPGLPPLEWLARAEIDQSMRGRLEMVARHGIALGIGTRYRWLRSSMLRAIEQGKTPAVDFLNGEVTSRGKKLGIPTPVNEQARDLVWAIARGERTASAETLEALCNEVGV
ncbi:MAG TPA: 2-dehydropantoate 2-reductase [Polyangiaceae bacterium]|nr:2-dehydropantoate 2-reductase [Polyangiaceae bacterium]